MANRCRFFYTVFTSGNLDVFCCIIPDLWCVFVNLDISLVTMSCCCCYGEILQLIYMLYVCFGKRLGHNSNNLPFQAPCNSWVEFGYYVLRGAPSWTWPRPDLTGYDWSTRVEDMVEKEVKENAEVLLMLQKLTS